MWQKAQTGLIATIFVLAWWVVVSEYRTTRQDPSHSTHSSNSPFVQPQLAAPIWGGYSQRYWSAQLDQQWRLDPTLARDQLLWSLERYPLDPWRWLTLARVEKQLGMDNATLEARLEAAWSIQPKHQQLNWEIVNLTQRLGDSEQVVGAIRHWLDGQPHKVHDALVLANQWVTNLPDRLEDLLPQDEAYWIRAMRFARTNRRDDVAQVVWATLDQPRHLFDDALKDYSALLLANKDLEAVSALWAQYDPSFDDSHIPGGHFHVPLASLATFGWDIRTPRGVSLEQHRRDLPPHFRSARWLNDQGWSGLSPGVITVSFDGQHNVNLSTPRLRLPIPKAGLYRLTGQWEGSGLTTRSLPYWSISTLKGRQRQNITLPNRNFPWTQFSVDIEITEPDETLVIELRRRPTQAFDRYIEGSVSITGLMLETIGDSEAWVSDTR